MRSFANAKVIREYIAANWRDETDAMIAKRFAVSRQYVMTARKRMGLVKDLTLIAEVIDITRPARLKNARRQLSEAEREEQRIKRKNDRDLARMKREYDDPNGVL